MMEKSSKEYNKNVQEQTKLIFEYQEMVNTLFGYSKIEVTKKTIQDMGDLNGVVYFVYVRKTKHNPNADYISFPQDFETVISFMLGLMHGIDND